MDDGTALLAGAIGSRVRTERTARGWTLDRLAAESGVSRRMVIGVEQGEVNPSVGTLLRLSDALGVGLPALVEPVRHSPVTLTRAGQGPQLWAGVKGGRGVLVAGTEPPDVVELWDWTLASGEQYTSDAHASRTRELLYVLAGTLTLTVAGEPVELVAGDAVSFPGDVAHSYANPDKGTARFCLAVFEPGVGTSTGAGASHA